MRCLPRPDRRLISALCISVLFVGLKSGYCEETTSAAPAKVSTYAPAEDLAGQMTKYFSDLDEALATEAEYNDQTSKVNQEANTIILIALALGLHDQDNKYKANAGALVEAARKLADAKDFETAKKANAQLKSAAAGEIKSNFELKWTKLASLPALMKQVPVVNMKVKRALKKNVKDAAGPSAVLGVIAQGALANISDTKKPDEGGKWLEFCTEFRSAAADVNSSANKGDAAAALAASERLQKACEDCHGVFKPEK